jgi:hypothetical protein
VSIIQCPIETIAQVPLLHRGKKRGDLDLSMKHSIMIGDRTADLIVAVVALGAVATFAALGFMVALQ